MLSASQLVERIIISRSTTQIVNNIKKTIKVVVADVAAKVELVQSAESYSADGRSASADFQFIVRWSTSTRAVKPKDSIQYKSPDLSSRVYEVIDLPREIGRRQFIAIKARLLDANS